MIMFRQGTITEMIYDNTVIQQYNDSVLAQCILLPSGSEERRVLGVGGI